MKDNENINMDIFGEVPYIEMDEGNDFLFTEDQEEDIIIEDNKEKVTVTKNEGEDPEEVVDDNQDEDDAEVESDDNSVEDSSPNLFSSLTALLVEKGLITSAESNIEDEDSFIDLFKNEIKKNEFSDLTESQKTYLENLRKGVPEEEIKENIKTVSQLESITDDMIAENSDLRQRIIYNDLITKGFSEEKALKFLKRSIELEADVEDAKESLESLKIQNKDSFQKRAEQIEKERIETEKSEKQRIENIKKKIKTTTEIIKDFKITDNVKEQVEKNMFSIVGKDPKGNDENALMKYARENKDDFELKLYYLYTITKGFENFDIIEKSKNSKVVSDLERALRSNTRIKDSGTPTYLQDPDSYSIEIAGHDLVLD
jgi:hypothetical protein